MDCDGPTGDASESLRGDECGSRGLRSQHGMNWSEMLRKGPGDSPGRAEAIARARARSTEKRLAKGRKRK